MLDPRQSARPSRWPLQGSSYVPCGRSASSLHAGCRSHNSTTPHHRLPKRVLPGRDGAAARPQCLYRLLPLSAAANFRRPRIDILSVRVAGPGKPKKASRII
ncbi:hypothetical protein BKA80DRAFT_41848 [Phyllosticta citrichinensis]